MMDISIPYYEDRTRKKRIEILQPKSNIMRYYVDYN